MVRASAEAATLALSVAGAPRSIHAAFGKMGYLKIWIYEDGACIIRKNSAKAGYIYEILDYKDEDWAIDFLKKPIDPQQLIEIMLAHP